MEPADAPSPGENVVVTEMEGAEIENRVEDGEGIEIENEAVAEEKLIKEEPEPVDSITLVSK